ncbi:MAG: Transglycosylase associated protein [Candidatus Jorgensenbacteria bacterium GW2011_GWA2_45_9]|uniref:Transglycosylase associated protein n=1 Tax=Candidatus Jorgensenbacteria bacterium GW2011_GWA2_45_9 TaxID=1618663 RepID=A0A0G1QBW0_9BACT|nr:MAG: Transglycosylase associated protein [Candidatus Jorgensenbacteria bacterium GW2011_GWA2_45_9]
MAWLVAIVAGALIGWIASMIMGTDNEMGWISNVLVGILGAVLGRWLFGSVLGIGSAFADNW